MHAHLVGRLPRLLLRIVVRRWLSHSLTAAGAAHRLLGRPAGQGAALHLHPHTRRCPGLEAQAAACPRFRVRVRSFLGSSIRQLGPQAQNAQSVQCNAGKGWPRGQTAAAVRGNGMPPHLQAGVVGSQLYRVCQQREPLLQGGHWRHFRLLLQGSRAPGRVERHGSLHRRGRREEHDGGQNRRAVARSRRGM
jgi:hypothetical protein